jgi:phosphoglycerate dehydrogenase-like enzyme
VSESSRSLQAANMSVHMTELPRVAILDDYQGAALRFTDWSVLEQHAYVETLSQHIGSTERLVEQLASFHVVCLMRERTLFTREIIERLVNLKLIVSTGMWNAAIDLAAARDLGVLVCGTGAALEPTVELTWALILAAVRNIPAELAAVKAGQWQISVGEDLYGRTLGILGLGNIGRVVARIALAFGMKLIAWSPNMTAEVARESGARLVDKSSLFRESDILTIHVKLGDRSRGIVGAAELGLMRSDAILVNTSRGPVVDEAALIDILTRGRIACAALDAYDQEPLPLNHSLRCLANVIATPHIGYVSRRMYETFFRDTVEDIVCWLRGRPIRVMT